MCPWSSSLSPASPSPLGAKVRTRTRAVQVNRVVPTLTLWSVPARVPPSRPQQPVPVTGVFLQSPVSEQAVWMKLGLYTHM